MPAPIGYMNTLQCKCYWS